MFIKQRRGATLLELMMVVSIISIIIIVVVSFFGKTFKMFTQLEVMNNLKTTGQREIGRLNRIISLNKRIFSSGSADDLAYLALVVNFLAADQAPIASSQLPNITVAGVLSPNETGFDPAIFGNSLFLATYGTPVSAIGINDLAFNPHNIKIDTYVFHYYYLNFTKDLRFFGYGGRNRLVGWHSKPYVDYAQIDGIGDNEVKKNLIIHLKTLGYGFAWVPAETVCNNAFYRLNPGGNATIAHGHGILKASIEFPLDTTTGLTVWSYPQGIAFNSSASFVIKNKVPLFAAVNGDFPGGLEIGIIGNNTGRQIFIRLVMAAQSGAGLQSYEHINLTTARDYW